MKNVGATHWTNEHAMRRATAIAKLIHHGVGKLLNAREDERNRAYQISCLAAAWRKDRNCTRPEIGEILLFGDIGLGASMASSVDMLLLDNGFFSSVLGFEPRSRWRPWGPLKVNGQGSENLGSLLVDYFGLNVDAAKFGNVALNFHVLPLSVFADEEKRIRCALRHSDPDVLNMEKLFAHRRYDPQTGEFVPATEERIRFLYAPYFFQHQLDLGPKPHKAQQNKLKVVK